jgi:prepilin-type N-terminal cleavage/methylation domain-containing protein
MYVSRSSVRGITLVEVLIVIAIIGLLASLSMPAIQLSREAARRSQCTSNIRQLGIGLTLYHDVRHVFPPTLVWSPAGEPLGNEMFPPGVIDRMLRSASATDRDRAYGSWLSMLLPHLEESALHSRMDFGAPMADPKNMGARATDLPVLKCPSDAFNGPENHFQRILPGGLPDLGYARANYAMNMGTNDWCLIGNFENPYHTSGSCTDGFWVTGSNLKTNVRQVWGSGIGGINKSFSARDFPSGLSKMVAIDEIRAGVNSADPRGVWALGFIGCSVTAGHGTYGTACGPNSVGPSPDAIANCTAARALAGGASALAALGMGCNPTIDEGAGFLAGARSLHVGGVNLLMLDGSVHFVVDQVDGSVWHNMHRRDNRVAIDLPF